MIDLTENLISTEIKKLVQNDRRFMNTYLESQDNYYIINQIKLKPQVSTLYEQLLESRAQAGSLHSTTENMDGSTAGYSKDMQLMNGKKVHMHIAFYRDKWANITAYYEDESINLTKDAKDAMQIAIELILPEFKNILDIMNKIDKEKEQDNNQR